jgi:hypothetical protein
MFERNGEVFVVAKECIEHSRKTLDMGRELLELGREFLNMGNKPLLQEARTILQDTLKELIDARKYVKQVHDEAEYRHDSDGEDYMSVTLYEVMQDTEDLLMRIDNTIRSYCSVP